MIFWQDFIILDLEYTDARLCITTKTIPSIIEVGMLRVSAEGKLQGQYESLVQPLQPETMSEFIHELTGITREELAIAPTFNTVYKEIISFIGNYPVVSWTGVDRFILQKNIEFACFLWPQRLQWWDIMSILTERYFQNTGLKLSSKLGKACEQIGVVYENKHRALSDCKAVLNLMTYIAARPLEKEKESKFEIYEV